MVTVTTWRARIYRESSGGDPTYPTDIDPTEARLLMSKLKMMVAGGAAVMLAMAAPLGSGSRGTERTVLVAQTQSNESPPAGASNSLSGYMVAVG